jgi:hypothetical protein
MSEVVTRELSAGFQAKRMTWGISSLTFRFSSMKPESRRLNLLGKIDSGSTSLDPKSGSREKKEHI